MVKETSGNSVNVVFRRLGDEYKRYYKLSRLFFKINKKSCRLFIVKRTRHSRCKETSNRCRFDLCPYFSLNK